MALSVAGEQVVKVTNASGGGRALPHTRWIPRAVISTWNYRHRIELEAADQFLRLSLQMYRQGVPEKITRLAHQAAADELQHAILCEKILTEFGSTLRHELPERGIILGPQDLSPERRALYASISLGAITETLSTALLIEMRLRAKHPIVHETVHSILEDEIRHSRVGWAHLSWERKIRDVTWLSEHIPRMLQEAMVSDLPSMIDPKPTEELTDWGILPRAHAKAIMLRSAREIILPGLAASGIDTAPAEHFIARSYSAN